MARNPVILTLNSMELHRNGYRFSKTGSAHRKRTIQTGVSGNATGNVHRSRHS